MGRTHAGRRRRRVSGMRRFDVPAGWRWPSARLCHRRSAGSHRTVASGCPHGWSWGQRTRSGHRQAGGSVMRTRMAFTRAVTCHSALLWLLPLSLLAACGEASPSASGTPHSTATATASNTPAPPASSPPGGPAPAQLLGVWVLTAASGSESGRRLYPDPPRQHIYVQHHAYGHEFRRHRRQRKRDRLLQR